MGTSYASVLAFHRSSSVAPHSTSATFCLRSLHVRTHTCLSLPPAHAADAAQPKASRAAKARSDHVCSLTLGAIPGLGVRMACGCHALRAIAFPVRECCYLVCYLLFLASIFYFHCALSK